MAKLKSKEWEIQHSTLAKKSTSKVTYEQCRKYSCEDISRNTSFIVPKNNFFVIEIPEEEDFHLIGRVSTLSGECSPNSYYNDFIKRNFASFSTINNSNISHYKGKPFFIYNILPEDIVHVFPLDSNTHRYASSEDDLTSVPSLWISLKDLEILTNLMKVYNQITCKTKRADEIIKPIAVCAFDELDNNTITIAKNFEIGCILVHPNKNAINYSKDLLLDPEWINSNVSDIMQRKYGIDLSVPP